MCAYYPFGAQTYYLGASIGSTDTSILLSSFLEPVTNTPYTMALINSTIVYATIGPKTSQSEFISFTGITQNSNGTATLTGVTRGLAKKYPFTTDSTYKLPHAGQSTFIISDAPQVFESFMTLANVETVTGIKTFATGATPLITDTPTTALMAANKAYVDSVAIAGAPNASTSVQGLVQEATLAQILARTTTGSTGAKLFIPLDKNISTLVSDYVADTGSANAYAIAPTPALTAYVTGQVFSFKATNANTTTSSLNVNALGAKTIKRSDGGNLSANDIIAGQIVVVEYDGTNFQLLSTTGNYVVDLLSNQTVGGIKAFTGQCTVPTPVGTTDIANKAYVDAQPRFTFKNGTATYAGDTASGTQTIAHGLGRTPVFVRITALKALTGSSLVSFSKSDGTYNGTTNACVSLVVIESGSGGGTVVVNSTTNAVIIDDNVTNNANQKGIITVDGTNITITWTKAGSPSSTNIQMMWEVE